MAKEFFYISNLLSLSRFFLAAVCAYCLINVKYELAVLVIIIIWITDLLDGYTARRRNEITELGKIIDPLADKTTIILIALILVIQEVIPVWFFLFVVIRALLILTGGIILKPKLTKMPQSNLTGKLTVFFIGLTFIMFLTEKAQFFQFLSYHSEFTELFLSVLLLISIVLIVFSIISYLNRFLKLLKQSTN